MASQQRERVTLGHGIVALIVLVVCAACGAGGGVTGSGVEKVEIRPVPPFTQVEIAGALSVEITFSETQTLHLTADDNIVSLITTEVKGTTLHVDSKRYTSKNPPVLRIVMPKLDALGVSGAGEVWVRGAKSDTFKVELSGAGRLLLDGSVRSLDLQVSGAGKVSAATLQADRAKVEVSGAAEVELNVLAALDVNVSGAGKVTYSGEPTEFKKNVSGAGSVDKR